MYNACALPPPVAMATTSPWGGKEKNVTRKRWACLPWGRCHEVTEGVNVSLYNESLVTVVH